MTFIRRRKRSGVISTHNTHVEKVLLFNTFNDVILYNNGMAQAYGLRVV